MVKMLPRSPPPGKAPWPMKSFALPGKPAFHSMRIRNWSACSPSWIWARKSRKPSIALSLKSLPLPITSRGKRLPTPVEAPRLLQPILGQGVLPKPDTGRQARKQVHFDHIRGLALIRDIHQDPQLGNGTQHFANGLVIQVFAPQ